MFLQSPASREEPATTDFDDLQTVVHGMSRVQLAQEDTASENPAAEADAEGASIFPLPISSTTSDGTKSPFRSPARAKRPRRLRSILKKPSTGQSKPDKKVVFSGVPEADSPVLSESAPVRLFPLIIRAH